MKESMDASELVSAFQDGRIGASHHAVKLAGATTVEAHDRLLRAGFTTQRIAVPGPRSREGSPVWRAPKGLTTTPYEARTERLYIHPDGAIVRLYLEGGPSLGFDELAPTGGPFARRSIVAVPGGRDLGWDDEAAVVTEEGELVPRNVRVADGIGYAVHDLVASYQLAISVLAEHRLPLRPTPWPYPPAALVDRRGLGAGLTLVPQENFWDATKEVEALAKDLRSVEMREKDGDLQLFFAGDPDVRETLCGSYPALASLVVHRGANVFSIDPIGYEASVQQVVEFVVALLPRLVPLVAYENFSGADVTAVLQRRPRAVLASMNAAALTFSAP